MTQLMFPSHNMLSYSMYMYVYGSGHIFLRDRNQGETISGTAGISLHITSELCTDRHTNVTSVLVPSVLHIVLLQCMYVAEG